MAIVRGFESPTPIPAARSSGPKAPRLEAENPFRTAPAGPGCDEGHAVAAGPFRAASDGAYHGRKPAAACAAGLPSGAVAYGATMLVSVVRSVWLTETTFAFAW